MDAPLMFKQQNAINAHQFKALHFDIGLPYFCPMCEKLENKEVPLLAGEDGLLCIACGYIQDVEIKHYKFMF